MFERKRRSQDWGDRFRRRVRRETERPKPYVPRMLRSDPWNGEIEYRILRGFL